MVDLELRQCRRSGQSAGTPSSPVRETSLWHPLMCGELVIRQVFNFRSEYIYLNLWYCDIVLGWFVQACSVRSPGWAWGRGHSRGDQVPVWQYQIHWFWQDVCLGLELRRICGGDDDGRGQRITVVMWHLRVSGDSVATLWHCLHWEIHGSTYLSWWLEGG